LQIRSKHNRILIVTDSSNPIINDLQWALYSPNLPVPKTLENWVWAGPDQHPLSLAQQHTMTSQLLPERQLRLGRYFEALCQSGLTLHPDWRLVLRSFPIRDAQRTLGELDLVLAHTQSQMLTHLELAIKFYIRIEQPHCGHSHHWMGPSLVDSYEQKLSRLMTHQIPMGLHPLVTQTLGAPVDEQAIMIKGRLFVSEDRFNAAWEARGYGLWITSDQLQKQWHRGDYLVIARPQWMTGPAHRLWQPVRFWQPRQHPCMIWLRGGETPQNTWAMVVPNDWESRAKACCPQQQIDF
jgi:hypothetical protein